MAFVTANLYPIEIQNGQNRTNTTCRKAHKSAPQQVFEIAGQEIQLPALKVLHTCNR